MPSPSQTRVFPGLAIIGLVQVGNIRLGRGRGRRGPARVRAGEGFLCIRRDLKLPLTRSLASLRTTLSGDRRPAAAAPSRGRLCRARFDRRLPAALDRERGGDLGPAHRDARSARRRRFFARPGAASETRGTVGGEDPHAQIHRLGAQIRHVRPCGAGRSSGRRSACGAHRAAWHRAVDRGYLFAVLPRPSRRLAGRRPRGAGGDAPGLRPEGAAERARDGAAAPVPARTPASSATQVATRSRPRNPKN